MIKYWVCIFLSVIIASFSQILLKVSARKTYPSVLREYLNPWVIVGYGMLVCSTLLTIFAYKGIAYKNGPVVESLGFVLVMMLSSLFLHEKITRRKLMGNMLIIAGIVVFYL